MFVFVSISEEARMTKIRLVEERSNIRYCIVVIVCVQEIKIFAVISSPMNALTLFVEDRDTIMH